MPARPTISVIIPCFRQGHFLSTAIDSILAQSYRDFEIIVINDGSDDNTDEVARSYGDKIVYISKTNGGLAAARNTGLEVARGRYVHFLDSDDFIHPQAFEKMIEAIAGRDNVLCLMGVRYLKSENLEESTYEFVPSPTFNFPRSLLIINAAPPHSYLTSTDIVKSTGGFDGKDKLIKGTEDWDMWVKVLMNGATPVTAEFLGAFYRLHPGSMSTNLNLMFSSYLWVLLRAFKLAKQRPEVLRNLGIDPHELYQEQRSIISKELYDNGYQQRQAGNFKRSIYFFLQLMTTRGSFSKGVLEIVKLVPHYLSSLKKFKRPVQN